MKVFLICGLILLIFHIGYLFKSTQIFIGAYHFHKHRQRWLNQPYKTYPNHIKRFMTFTFLCPILLLIWIMFGFFVFDLYTFGIYILYICVKHPLFKTFLENKKKYIKYRYYDLMIDIIFIIFIIIKFTV